PARGTGPRASAGSTRPVSSCSKSEALGSATTSSSEPGSPRSGSTAGATSGSGGPNPARGRARPPPQPPTTPCGPPGWGARAAGRSAVPPALARTRVRISLAALALAALPLHPAPARAQGARPTPVEPGDLTRRPDLVGREVVVDDRVAFFQYHRETDLFDQIYL